MKVISISKKRFNELKPFNLSKNVTNTEAKMYEFNYKNEEKIVKALFHLDGLVFANKLYTIEMLDYNKKYLPTSFLIPDYLCTANHEVIGFTIPRFDGINMSDFLNDIKGSNEEKIYYLKQIGELLYQLQNIRKYTPLSDIYINDLQESNFLIDYNNKELKVIDLDSCKIGDNKVFPSRYLSRNAILNYSNKYKVNNDKPFMGYIIPDSNSDLYCYTMIVLNYLYKGRISSLGIDEFYEYINYLESIGIAKDLICAFIKIVDNCNNENPMYYLDSLTDRQIGMASNFVYKKVKNKNI